MKKYLFLLFFLQSLLYSENVNAIFMGIVPGTAPELEKSLELMMREQIALIPGIDIVGYDKTEFIKRKTDFFRTPLLSRSFIDFLIKNVTKNELIIWGKVSDFEIKPVRQWLIGAKAVGLITLTINMYSLSFREYTYLSDVKCSTSIVKPPVFFRNVDKVTHITASERSDIIIKLRGMIAEKVTHIIGAVVRSLPVEKEVLLPENIKKKEAPKVSDIFDIPFIESEDIVKKVENKKGRDSQKVKDEKGKVKKDKKENRKEKDKNMDENTELKGIKNKDSNIEKKSKRKKLKKND